MAPLALQLRLARLIRLQRIQGLLALQELQVLQAHLVGLRLPPVLEGLAFLLHMTRCLRQEVRLVPVVQVDHLDQVVLEDQRDISRILLHLLLPKLIFHRCPAFPICQEILTRLVFLAHLEVQAVLQDNF